jgi:dTMP kinase
MALLFAADRADHVEAEIEPNLRDGVTVISDRYYHSSIAYQSATAPEGSDRRGDVARWVREINRYARRPDLTIVLDVSPEVAAKRRAERSKTSEIYDDLDLQRELSRFYKEIDAFFPDERIVHVDSSGSREDVAAEILAHVRRARGEKV